VYVLRLGFLEGVASVEGGFVVSKAGIVYIGTAPGGKMLKYVEPDLAPENVPQVSKPLVASDLGAPVSG
jgi:hypothetical protein